MYQKQYILSASTDGIISLWSLEGAHIGIFGQRTPWSLDDRTSWRSKASTKTLTMTMMGGMSSMSGTAPETSMGMMGSMVGGGDLVSGMEDLALDGMDGDIDAEDAEMLIQQKKDAVEWVQMEEERKELQAEQEVQLYDKTRTRLEARLHSKIELKVQRPSTSRKTTFASPTHKHRIRKQKPHNIYQLNPHPIADIPRDHTKIMHHSLKEGENKADWDQTNNNNNIYSSSTTGGRNQRGSISTR